MGKGTHRIYGTQGTGHSSHCPQWFHLLLAVFCFALPLAAVDRFPRPEFEGGHLIPTAVHPHPLPNVWACIDVGILVLALAAAAYFALYRRSRRAMLATTCVSLAYFGFFRNGCVCSVGSLQNITLTLCDATYAVPATVIAFFVLPLVAALLCGRVFCAAVCPLGAIQEVLVIKPLHVPRWLAETLGMIPYVYLAFAVLFAATRSFFLICGLDPFVSLFRLGGDAPAMVLGLFFLLLGLFVARPYCRFLCPYGVLLRWFSRLSFCHTTITPDECIQCRMCENACPYGAIRKPTEGRTFEPLGREIARLATMLVLIPLLTTGGAAIGHYAGSLLSFAHPTVRLAAQLHAEDTGIAKTPTLQSAAFRATGTPVAAVYRDAAAIRHKFGIGAACMGGFIGLALGCKLAILSIRRKRVNYEPDRGDCVSCGRCFFYCPRERLRLKNLHGGTHA